FFKQKTAYEIETRLEFRRVLFRSVNLRVGIAVGTDRSERRLPIEDVVRAEAEVELVRNPGREGQVKEALRWQPRIARVRPRHTARLVDIAVLGCGVVSDCRKIAPLAGNSEAIRQRKANPELVPPSRIRRAAAGAVEGGTIKLA